MPQHKSRLRWPAFHGELVIPLLEVLKCHPLDHVFGLRLVKPPGKVVRWIVESVCDFSSKRRNLACGGPVAARSVAPAGPPGGSSTSPPLGRNPRQGESAGSSTRTETAWCRPP